MSDLDPALPASLRAAAPATADDADRYLMWGMLVDAAEALVLCAADPWRDDEVLVREIRDWVLADDPDWPFSFVNACTAAGIDVATLRRELGAWLTADAAERG
jgi:hypothetical protein